MDPKSIRDLFMVHLLNDEMKVKICTLINENVNIPMIGEKTEQRVFESIWEIFETAIREQLDKEIVKT